MKMQQPLCLIIIQ